MQDKSGNPALKDSVLDKLKAQEGSATATIGGTAVKIFALLIATFIGGFFGWQAMVNATGALTIMVAGASIIAFVFALITIFKPNLAAYTGPLYALTQGYVLGAISQIYNTQLNGIVLQAISLTGAIFFVSLWAFSIGAIKVSDKMRTGIIIATAGIAVYYLMAIIMSFFGITMPLIYDSGPWGIAFSLLIVFIATLNLILDYDLIQKLVQRGAPKKMEWYGAFALIVTLLWLYVEVLRLLSKVRQ